jgi:hypothetical protein
MSFTTANRTEIKKMCHETGFELQLNLGLDNRLLSDPFKEHIKSFILAIRKEVGKQKDNLKK